MSDAADREIEDFLRAHGPFEKPPILSCGERVGDWKALAFLGRGGSAEAFRAENVVTGIVGALKVLYRTDDAARARFRREARLIAETKSAAFPKFYGAGESEGRLYIAEELLEPIELPSDELHPRAALCHRCGFRAGRPPPPRLPLVDCRDGRDTACGSHVLLF